MAKSKMNNDNDDKNFDKIIIPMKKSIIEDNNCFNYKRKNRYNQLKIFIYNKYFKN